jgi:hypothetical protein
MCVCLSLYHVISGLRGFAENAWFTRSWTLQRLVASSGVEGGFFDSNWGSIGITEKLRDKLTAITRIDAAIILPPGNHRSNPEILVSPKE